MVSAINSALSGLDFASKKLDTSANNIANAFSSDKNSQAFAPQPTQSVAQGVDTVVKSAYQPPQQNTQNNGTDSAGGNDVTNDLVNTNIASYDFQANLKVIETSNKTLQSFLNIIS